MVHQSDAALKVIDQALQIEPTHNKLLVLKGNILLSLDRYEEGFPLMDLWHDNTGIPDGYQRFLSTRWNGEATTKKIVIWDDQGFGDCIFYLRYVPLVKKLVPKLWVSVHSPLRKLVEVSFPNVHLADAPIPKFTEHGIYIGASEPLDGICPISTVPVVMGTTYETIPSDIPYLKAPRTIISDTKIGICWESGRDWSNHDMKSIPHKMVRSLIRQHRMVSLMRNDLAVKDFSGTASIIQGLDLVITVDTAVAHLAAALDKQVWLMLSYHCDWRWGQNRDYCKWYPTMRLFRQSSPGDWTSVLSDIKSAI